MIAKLKKKTDELDKIITDKFLIKVALNDKEKKSEDIGYLKGQLAGNKVAFYLMIGCIIITLAMMVWVSRNYENTVNTSEKYLILKKHLPNKYYKPENIEKAMQNVLDKNYKEGTEANFDNYVVQLVLNDLNQYDEIERKRYTRFTSNEDQRKENEIMEQMGNNPVYEARGEYYYMQPRIFLEDATHRVLEEHIEEIKGYDHLLLDLRGNPGGHVDSLLKYLDYFNQRGEIFAKQKYYDGDEFTKEYVAELEQEIKFKKMVILVNNNTASCSEILIASLKSKFDNVIIVGENTLGKGVGGTTYFFKDGSSMTYLSSFWYDADGQGITTEGITPDVIEADEKRQLEIAEDLIRDKI